MQTKTMREMNSAIVVSEILMADTKKVKPSSLDPTRITRQAPRTEHRDISIIFFDLFAQPNFQAMTNNTIDETTKISVKTMRTG